MGEETAHGETLPREAKAGVWGGRTGQGRGWCLSTQGCGDRAFPLCCSAHTSPEGDL